MKKEDTTIFEYRMQKEIKNTEAIMYERMHGTFEKYCVYTDSAGYIDISIYRPQNYQGNALPAVFSFHGGGFVLGYYELDGKYCQRLANATNCAIINVDYCLAPEFKFPIPILSSYEAIACVKKDAFKYKIDANRIMVMGHSAGGNIAVGMCLLDRERKEVGIKGQIVDYAPLKQSISEEDRKVNDPSKAMSRSRMLQYIHWYFNDLNDLENPLASPVLSELENLPRTLMISAELDSLCQEEKEFADKAREAGVDIIYEVFKDCQHGFTHEELIEYKEDEAKRAWEHMSRFIRETI